MELERLGFGDVALMDGERIDAALNLRDGLSGDLDEAGDIILLTERRVIHLNASARRRTASFVSVQDIDAVEINAEREGRGAIAWGGLAFVVAIMVWRIWDHPIGSALGAVAVALMGVYLIVDYWLSPGNIHATFKAGSSELHCGLKSAEASKDIYTFVNRLFQLKGESDRHGEHRSADFAPR